MDNLEKALKELRESIDRLAESNNELRDYLIQRGAPTADLLRENEVLSLNYSDVCRCNPNNGGNGVCNLLGGMKTTYTIRTKEDLDKNRVNGYELLIP